MSLVGAWVETKTQSQAYTSYQALSTIFHKLAIVKWKLFFMLKNCDSKFLLDDKCYDFIKNTHFKPNLFQRFGAQWLSMWCTLCNFLIDNLHWYLTSDKSFSWLFPNFGVLKSLDSNFYVLFARSQNCQWRFLETQKNLIVKFEMKKNSKFWIIQENKLFSEAVGL